MKAAFPAGQVYVGNDGAAMTVLKDGLDGGFYDKRVWEVQCSALDFGLRFVAGGWVSGFRVEGSHFTHFWDAS